MLVTSTKAPSAVLIMLIASLAFRIPVSRPRICDVMRDEIGSSKCFACNSELATTAALRRHLDVCPNICAPCPQEGCSFYGTRAECTAHFRDVHERLTCPCCHESVLLAEWKNHAQKHMADLNIAVETDSRRWRVFSCGTFVRNS